MCEETASTIPCSYYLLPGHFTGDLLIMIEGTKIFQKGMPEMALLLRSAAAAAAAAAEGAH